MRILSMKKTIRKHLKSLREGYLWRFGTIAGQYERGPVRVRFERIGAWKRGRMVLQCNLHSPTSILCASSPGVQQKQRKFAVLLSDSEASSFSPPLTSACLVSCDRPLSFASRPLCCAPYLLPGFVSASPSLTSYAAWLYFNTPLRVHRLGLL